MPRVVGPLFSGRASGSLGDGISFQGMSKGVRVEKRPRHKDRKSDVQLSHRALFKEAASSWRVLSPEGKAEYEDRASGLAMTGYNLYVAEYLLEAGMVDEKVKVSVTDLVAGYLAAKLAAGDGVGLEVLNEGAEEQLQISHVLAASGDLHTEYARLGGRAGGQTLIGGTEEGDALRLVGTEVAANGYLEVQGDTVLFGSAITVHKFLSVTGVAFQDLAGNTILAFTATPSVDISADVNISGNTDITGLIAIGSGAVVDTARAVNVVHTFGAGSGGAGIWLDLTYQNTCTITMPGTAVRGAVRFQGAAGASRAIIGFLFNVSQESNSVALLFMRGFAVQLTSVAGSAGITAGIAFDVDGSQFQGASPSEVYGFAVRSNIAGAATGTLYGVHVADQTVGPAGASCRLLNIGSTTTPFLRVTGNGEPGANQTNVYMNENGTLRRVQWKAGNSLGAGDKVMVLV